MVRTVVVSARERRANSRILKSCRRSARPHRRIFRSEGPKCSCANCLPIGANVLLPASLGVYPLRTHGDAPMRRSHAAPVGGGCQCCAAGQGGMRPALGASRTISTRWSMSQASRLVQSRERCGSRVAVRLRNDRSFHPPWQERYGEAFSRVRAEVRDRDSRRQ